MSYLERERAKGNGDVGTDVLALAPEDGEIGYGKDVVRLSAALAAGDRGVVLHEPVVHVCIRIHQ